MSKRLQVFLQDPEYHEIQRIACARRMSVAQWVRQALLWSNVPMSFVGASHPSKVEAQRLLERAIA